MYTTPHGLTTPNSTVDGDGFYISFNPVDIAIYGDVTTALVTDDLSAFYILKGDHRAAYRPLIQAGLQACLAYFHSHPELVATARRRTGR